jgi:PilZ domain
MSQPKPAPVERRRSDRSALRLTATLRDGTRKRVKTRVIDISTHGCRIECPTAVGADSWIWLSISGLETQYCRVVWNFQEFVGLEFASPLSEVVFDRLLQDQEQLPETAINELRDIASRTNRLARQAGDADIAILAELSRKCAVDAVVEGLRLGQSARPSKK